jgi:PAS domain S-box-containing protein
MRAAILSVLCFCPWQCFSSDTLTVRGDFNYPPFEFINEQGQPDGFNVDIMRAVAAETGLDIEISLGPWNEVREQLENADIDLLMGMYNTEERDLLVDFSTPHLIVSYSVFVRDDSDIDSLPETLGRIIIVQYNDLGYDFAITNRLTDSLLVKSTIVEALTSLSSGQGDCALISHQQGLVILNEMGITNVRATGSHILQVGYCFAVQEGNSALLNTLNEGLSNIRVNGIYDEIYNSWFGIQGISPRASLTKLARNAVAVSAVLVFLLLLFFCWSWSLKRKVRERTKELAEARNHIINIINSMPSVIIGLDGENRITLWNKAAEDETGYTALQALGNTLDDMYGTVITEIKLLAGEPGEVTSKLTHLRGEDRAEIFSVFPLKNGSAKGVVIRIDDISRSYSLEKELSQVHKMESIGQLAGGIAHDFNNMLAGILGAADVLSERVSESNKPLLGIILNSAERASELTRKLLAFSRKGKITSTPVDVHAAMENAVAILRNTLNRNVAIEVEAKANLCIVVGDDSQLQNIFLNLGINAGQSMQNGGRVSITTHNIYLTSEDTEAENTFKLQPGTFIEITVTDTGSGIDHSIIPRIFEPYFTTKHISKGTGLGLASVYGSVLDHHGSIQVNSIIGKGTSFVILLPVTEEPVSREIYSTTSLPGTGTVLLVDDEELVRVILRELLENLNYRVICSGNGMEALELFRKHHKEITVVLLDMIMPGIDGKEVFSRLREIDSDVKVIISSGFSTREDLSDILETGQTAFIKKPYRSAELSRVLASMTD